MGNHYRYQLVVRDGKEESAEASAAVASLVLEMDKLAQYFIDENGDSPGLEEGDWKCMATMREVSRFFPSWRIILYTDDDCANDHQVHYFVNGAYYWDDAELVYPEFDPARLEEPRAF